jgi:hypothetical protein
MICTIMSSQEASEKSAAVASTFDWLPARLGCVRHAQRLAVATGVAGVEGAVVHVRVHVLLRLDHRDLQGKRTVHRHLLVQVVVDLLARDDVAQAVGDVRPPRREALRVLVEGHALALRLDRGEAEAGVLDHLLVVFLESLTSTRSGYSIAVVLVGDAEERRDAGPFVLRV